MEEKMQEKSSQGTRDVGEVDTIHPGDLPIQVNFPLTEKIILRKLDQNYGVILRTFYGEHEGKRFEFSVADPLPIQFRQSVITQPGVKVERSFPVLKTGRG